MKDAEARRRIEYLEEKVKRLEKGLIAENKDRIDELFTLYRTEAEVIKSIQNKIEKLLKEVAGESAEWKLIADRIPRPKQGVRELIELLLNHFNLEYKKGEPQPDKLVKKTAKKKSEIPA